MLEATTVGHFSIDSIYLPISSKPNVTLGGSVAYFALSARRLGANVTVISKIGSDFPEAYLWWLKQEGVDVSNVKRIEGASTTRFELKYSLDLSNRNLRLISRAPSISVNDIPDSLKTKAAHVAPIAGEVENEAIEKLSKCADLLSIDPQGLLRVFNGHGKVSFGRLQSKRILEFFDVYKSSLEEIKCITGISDVKPAMRAIHDLGVEIVMVTLGMRGSVLSHEGASYEIPAYCTDKIVDPTGAGDVFIASFLVEYLQKKDSLWCAYVASAAASVAVESIGPTFSSSKTEIYRRAHALFERTASNQQI